jgi:cbb3-type cytochrome oxidase maturation protein
MNVLFLLIPASLFLASLFVALCVASIKDGQFDDLESPRWRVLFDGRPELSGLTEMNSKPALQPRDEA